MPGCFDSFDGTQEELDELQAQIVKMFETGEVQGNARIIDMDTLEDTDPDLYQLLQDTEGTGRTLQ